MTRTEQSGEAPSLQSEARLLIDAAIAGDRGAAQNIMSALLPRIRNLVRYLVRRDRDVDDIAQEALIAVLRGLRTFRHESSLETWSDRVTARVTFAHLRKRRSEPFLSLVDSDSMVHSNDAYFTTGDEYIVRRRIVAALDVLPLEQRAAFVLHHVLEMSVGEVAHEVQAPPETVRSRIRLARNRLREQGLALGDGDSQAERKAGTT